MRFQEFEGEWELKKLSDITIKVNSGKTPLGGEAVYLDKGVLFIRSQNVNNNRLELENSVFISEEINNQMKNSVVKSNDILLNITGASLGRSCVVPDDFLIGNVNQHVCIIRLNQQYSPRFIQPKFSSNKGQIIFNNLQTGSGREGLNFESIKGIKLYIPSKDEQEKVATFLSVIDQRIETQNKIIEHLETLINSFRRQLLNKKLSFGHEFHLSDWKECTISEILKIGSGKDYKHLNTGEIPVFGTGGLMNFVDTYLFNGETVCIGRKGTIDKPMYYNGKIWTVDTLFYTHSFKYCIPKFVFHLFKTINWLEYKEASGVPSLSKSTIEKIKIKIPSIKEQEVIASFLNKIEEKLNLEKANLNQFIQYKKYLLSEMFI